MTTFEKDARAVQLPVVLRLLLPYLRGSCLPGRVTVDVESFDPETAGRFSIGIRLDSPLPGDGQPTDLVYAIFTISPSAPTGQQRGFQMSSPKVNNISVGNPAAGKIELAVSAPYPATRSCFASGSDSQSSCRAVHASVSPPPATNTDRNLGE